jgi:hypothetical protein
MGDIKYHLTLEDMGMTPTWKDRAIAAEAQLIERDAMIGWLRDALEDAATTFAGIYMKRESSDLPPYTDAYYCDLCGEDWSTSDNCPACKIARLSKLASGDAEEAEAAR